MSEGMLFPESSISSLGGMARIRSKDDYFSCPPWIPIDQWKEYRTLYTKASQGASSFLQLDLELTDNCNYKCLECPISDSLEGRKISSLSESDIAQILGSARNLGALALKLNYINEPLLNSKMLFKAAEIAKSLGYVDIYFTTNGSMMSTEVNKRLISSQLFSRVQVSLDAVHSHTYSSIRRGGSLPKVLSNIQNFLSLRALMNVEWPKLRVSFLSLPENIHEQEEFYNYWINKVDAVALQSSVLKPNSQRGDISSYNNTRSTYCPNPHRQLVVRADKSILPCCSFWGVDLQLGSYEHSLSLDQAFNSSKMKGLQSTFTNQNDNKLHPACQSCLSSCDPTVII